MGKNIYGIVLNYGRINLLEREVDILRSELGSNFVPVCLSFCRVCENDPCSDMTGHFWELRNDKDMTSDSFSRNIAVIGIP